jgi:hypothetical protein
VTRHDYYVKRAAECLLASEQISIDRGVLLHMAATYIKIAIESELHRPSGPVEPPGLALCAGAAQGPHAPDT